MLLQPLKRLTGVNEHLQRGLAACESVFGLVDETPEEDRGTVVLERAKGAMRFEDVSLTYRAGTRPALDGVAPRHPRPARRSRWWAPRAAASRASSTCCRASTTRRAGASRSTATTLEALTLESLRRQIALVSQNVVLFNDTVAANIAYGQGERATRSRHRARRRGRARHGIHPRRCRRGSPPRSARTARSSPAASASASRSRARSSRTRRSCSSTRPPPRSTRRASARCRRPSRR